MDETPQPQQIQFAPHSKKWVIPVVGMAVVVAIAAGMWWLNGRVQELSDKVDEVRKTSAETTKADAAPGPITLVSGKEAFSLTVPAGWGPLTKATDSDFFILPGKTQPVLADDAEVEVIETDSYGSDSASVFLVTLSDAGISDAPRGSGSEFTIGKGNEALVGKKYAYTYPADEQVGIGYTRHQNDREYRYTFTTKSGKKLDVVYNVYGSDPRNHADAVDGIVQSIVVK